MNAKTRERIRATWAIYGPAHRQKGITYKMHLKAAYRTHKLLKGKKADSFLRWINS